VVSVALAGILVLPEFIPAVKAWSRDHQYTSVLGLLTVAIAGLWFLCRKKHAIVDAPSNAVLDRRSAFASPITIAVALLLVAGAAVGLQYRKTHQKLGIPGVKVVPKPIYDPEGKLAGTNSVALPERVLNFESTVIPMDRVVLDWLPKDTTYAQRLYKAADGFQAQMNVVLMGADRTSIHQPQYCLTGNGWQIDQSEIESISVNQPRAYQLPVSKLTVSRLAPGDDGAKTELRGIYVYWFVADNRLTAHHGERMLDMGLDTLRTGVLQRWAYASCFAVCYPGQEQATYDRLKELISAVVPEFQLTTGETATLARHQ
jgi:hypothetical protein